MAELAGPDIGTHNPSSATKLCLRAAELRGHAVGEGGGGSKSHPFGTSGVHV